MGKRNSSSKRNQSHVPAWVWLFTGAILGAFVMFLVNLSNKNNTVSSTNQADLAIEKAAKKREDIRFDFYDVLKKNQVEIPKEARHPNNKPGSTTQKSNSTQNTEFLLQVGSFKNGSDAERLRAELILLNLPAIVEQAKIRNGETWHRVIVGPFKSKSKLASARSMLISNRHEALVLKRNL